jgi:putative transposase
MAHPARNAAPANILNPSRIFFATTKTSMGKRLLQSERNANLLIDVLRSLVAERKFELCDFVIMPDHVHLLLIIHDEMTIRESDAIHQGRVFASFETRIRVYWRGLAQGIHLGAGDGPGEL